MFRQQIWCLEEHVHCQSGAAGRKVQSSRYTVAGALRGAASVAAGSRTPCPNPSGAMQVGSAGGSQRRWQTSTDDGMKQLASAVRSPGWAPPAPAGKRLLGRPARQRGRRPSSQPQGRTALSRLHPRPGQRGRRRVRSQSAPTHNARHPGDALCPAMVHSAAPSRLSCASLACWCSGQPRAGVCIITGRSGAEPPRPAPPLHTHTHGPTRPPGPRLHAQPACQPEVDEVVRQQHVRQPLPVLRLVPLQPEQLGGCAGRSRGQQHVDDQACASGVCRVSSRQGHLPTAGQALVQGGGAPAARTRCAAHR